MTIIKGKIDDIGDLPQKEDIRSRKSFSNLSTLISNLELIILLMLDTLMLLASWKFAAHTSQTIAGLNIANSVFPILAISIGTLTASGFYGTDDKLHRFTELFKSLTLAQIIVFIATFFNHPSLVIPGSAFILVWILNLLFVGGARFLLGLMIIQIRQSHPTFQQAVMLIGNQVDVDRFKKILKRSNQFRVDSIIDLSVWDMDVQMEQILDKIKDSKVKEVFLCSKQLINNQIILFWSLKAAGIHLRIIPTELQLPQRASETKMIGEIPTIRFKSLPTFGINFQLKRLLDLICSFIILVLISPAFLVIAILIKKTSPGPIFYKQYRVGLKGHRFQVWKFRTMVENASRLQQELESKNEVKGGVLFKIREDPRITKIGRFLRHYSLDELPQLLNVLQGQMSLVGPRPLAIRDYELSIKNVQGFSKDKFLRYEVLPGITGLWQTRGRASTDSDEIFYWDMVYILQWSLSLDFKILLETIRVVILKEGSY
jgi:exopolysaccharide biosynthesis polyprenyl glycosylphosphotransferase